MSNFYRKTTVSDTEPASPAPGDKWIEPLASGYDVRIYLAGDWRSIISGGTKITETDIDTHYHNFIESPTQPASIQYGWYWHNTATQSLYYYIGQYVNILSY